MNDREFDKALISSIRPLRGYAQLLTRSYHEAEDLSQQTLLKAWANRTQFQPGTNLRAWLYTIAHNEFCSRYRKARRETGMRDGSELERFGVYPEQYGRLDLADMQKALAKLPPEQREALLLISDAELSYGEAADKVHLPMGTIKSRANRARSKLAKLLQVASSTEFGPDTHDVCGHGISPQLAVAIGSNGPRAWGTRQPSTSRGAGSVCPRNCPQIPILRGQI